MNKLNEIQKRLDNFKKAEEGNLIESQRKSQNRLKEMVNIHGIDCVSLASGLTEKTLKQYIQVKVPPSIKKDTVDKAEAILKGL